MVSAFRSAGPGPHEKVPVGPRCDRLSGVVGQSATQRAGALTRRDNVRPAAIPWVAALAAFLLAVAWSLTSAALLTSPASAHPPSVSGPATVAQARAATSATSDDDLGQVDQPSTAVRGSRSEAAGLGGSHERAERDGPRTTLASSVLSPRHPRRAVPPDRRVPIGSAFVGVLLLGAAAACPRVCRTCAGPPRCQLTPPVESRAPPSGRLRVA